MQHTIYSSVTRQGGVLQFTDKPFKAPSVMRGKRPAKAELKPNKKGRKTRNANRTLNKLTQTLQRMKPAPLYLMSLIIDRRIPQDEEPAAVHKALRSFVRRVAYRYPAAYFIIVLGWSRAAGIHAHIVTDLGQVRRKRLMSTGRRLRKLWMDTIGSENVKTFQLDKYEEDYFASYLTNGVKQHEAVVLRHRLGKGRIWSIVNKPYIRLAKPETLYFKDEIEREQFNQILIGLMREYDVHKSNFSRIQRPDNCNNYLTEDLLQKAFDEFRAWRAAW